MPGEFQVSGKSAIAPFTLRVHRGEGMALLAMNWRNGPPPDDFVGFAIEYKAPGGTSFLGVRNRLAFMGPTGTVDPDGDSSVRAPIQKFRWVHFPFDAELPGKFSYRVRPAFMKPNDSITFGKSQQVSIELARETYPDKLNVTFTRGFVSSQAFVDRYESVAPISTLLPADADNGLLFVPTHPRAKKALTWMGFEARHAILEVLDRAIADPAAEVRVVAYDLSEPDVVSRLEQLGTRVKVIIDDEGAHGAAGSGENQAEARLKVSAGSANVKRQHMGHLQHNKTIVVNSPQMKTVVCGSTNFTWRGFFVQANNAVIMQGQSAIAPFLAAFDAYHDSDEAKIFGKTTSAEWTDLGLTGIDASVAFSPHSSKNALLKTIATDIGENTTSSLFYSLAFLYQTKGVIRDAIQKITADATKFVYGISDRKVGGIVVQKPDGNLAPVNPAALSGNVPEPFKSEPIGGGGNRMHHKFVVIDFDKPTARVYLGSYNFSSGADKQNGENLLLVKDRRIAVSYTIEALRLFDHYHFRVAQNEAEEAGEPLVLRKPPREAGEVPWWTEHFTDAHKIRDRELFA